MISIIRYLTNNFKKNIYIYINIGHQALPSTTARLPSSRRLNQEYFTGARNKVRSTTTQTPASEKAERRRPQLDRKRYKQEQSRSTTTTISPEIITGWIFYGKVMRKIGKCQLLYSETYYRTYSE